MLETAVGALRGDLERHVHDLERHVTVLERCDTVRETSIPPLPVCDRQAELAGAGQIDVLIETDYPLLHPAAGAEPRGSGAAPAPPQHLLIDSHGHVRICADGLIIDYWMPQHPCWLGTEPWTAPLPQTGCKHGKPEWFTAWFNKDSSASQYFASARDVDLSVPDAHLRNKLQTQCSSARDVLQFPHHDAWGSTLYRAMVLRRSLFIQWRNGRHGEFSLCFGCEICKSATRYYQPQNQLGELGLNPHNVSGEDQKTIPEVQQAFRSFAAAVLEDPRLLPEAVQQAQPPQYAQARFPDEQSW